MSITDYGTLKTAVAARAVRTDLTSLIPDFIRASHDVIVNRMAVATTLDADADTEALPTDLRELVTAYVEAYPGQLLGLVHASQFENGGSGCPQYFGVSGSNILLYPTPNATYRVRLLYKLARDMFSADADTNTVLARYPFLYLHGAMAELFAHARDLDQETKYRTLFASGIEAANAAELEDLYANVTLQPRMQGVI